MIDRLYRAHKACLIQPRECLGLRSLLSFGGINTYLRPLPRASAGLEFFHSAYTPGAVPPLLTRCAHDSLCLKCCSFFSLLFIRLLSIETFPAISTAAPPQPHPHGTRCLGLNSQFFPGLRLLCLLLGPHCLVHTQQITVIHRLSCTVTRFML